ncbi:MAG: ribonuclease P protein component [Bacteroidota bacterium]|nr:ribonuclease P protein component [Bacteroidota bacterium]
MTIRRYTFPPSSRLKSRKKIETLFTSGHSLFQFPLLLKFNIHEVPELNKLEIKAAFTVSKKKFSKATQRNLLKRRMKEAYRFHFRQYLESAHVFFQMDMMWIYTGTNLEHFNVIEKSMVKLLKSLQKDMKPSGEFNSSEMPN